MMALHQNYFTIDGSPQTRQQALDYLGIAGVPYGSIVLWHGSIATIPSGWHLCDGTNGTPDLRNKFVVGANADDSGVAKSTITGSAVQSGGANTHNHTVSGDTGATETYLANGFVAGLDVPGAGDNSLVGTYAVASSPNFSDAAGGHLHAVSITSSTSSNIPTFFALAYIMKL